MTSIVLGTLGFVLFYIYDINSVTKNNKILRYGFFVGLFCLVVATAMVITSAFSLYPVAISRLITFGLIFLLFFLLLIYTLFFVLPFNDTYIQESNKICDTGVYALCRHPGVIWFLGMYLCVWGLFPKKEMGIFVILVNVLNYLYVVLQDVYIFPKSFRGYEEYKKNTPFLIPNIKSIVRCFKTL